MSWLLAVLVPVLLMVVTFGLERLEAALEPDDADEEDPIGNLVLQTAVPVERVHRPVPAAAHPAHHSDLPHVNGVSSGLAVFDDEPGLPTRLCRSDVDNPQFQPTRQANPV